MYCPKCGASVSPPGGFCPTCGAHLGAAPVEPQAVASAIPAAPAYRQQTSWNYAAWGARAIGYIIDVLLVGVGMTVLYFLLGATFTSLAHLAIPRYSGEGEVGGGVCCMMLLLFPFATFLVGLYNSVFLIAQRGYSIGQGVMRVMVVDGSGNLLTAGTAFIRLLVRVAFGFVPFLPALDLLWPLWDVRRQTLHDKAVNSYVINMR
jgi:uncharacterized RDD family membrane protein YckC